MLLAVFIAPSGLARAAGDAPPSLITPPTVLPPSSSGGVNVDITPTGGLQAPAGSANLTVHLGTVDVDGSFREVAAQVAPIVAQLQGRTVSVATIYRAAAEIEAIHARAGFVLARATIPPQHLVDGGPLRIVVIDGFIEAVQVNGLPQRVRSVIARRTAALIGRRHIRLSTIEQALLLAAQAPGVALSSVLARGSQPGGTTLILAGTQQPVSGTLSADNLLPASIGTWETSGTLALNSLFNDGEQFYGLASGAANGSTFGSNPSVSVLGGGIVIPSADGRLTFNPEYTHSFTQPIPAPGAPATRGNFERISLRSTGTLVLTRSTSLRVSAALQQIDETNAVVENGFLLSEDRYTAARAGASYSRNAGRSAFAVDAQFSQGLGSLWARTAADVASSGIPYSALGASTSFSTFAGSLRYSTALGSRVQLALIAHAQTSFGEPLFTAEQFTLDGPDAVSGFPSGSLPVDAGETARIEFSAPLGRGGEPSIVQVAPYVFGAAGWGTIAQATVLQAGTIDAQSFGVGIRLNRDRIGNGAADGSTGLGLALELARHFSNAPGFPTADQLNVSASMRL